MRYELSSWEQYPRFLYFYVDELSIKPDRNIVTCDSTNLYLYDCVQWVALVDFFADVMEYVSCIESRVGGNIVSTVFA